MAASAAVQNKNLNCGIPATLGQLMEASTKLIRLSRLDSALEFPKLEQRAAAIDVIRDRIVTSQSLKVIREGLSGEMRDFVALLLEGEGEIIPLEKQARAVSELGSILVPPAFKSHRGDRGPTIIVNFPIQLEEKFLQEAYVLKWSDWNELFVTRLYSELSLASNRAAGFLVPTLAGLDLDRNLHLESGGDLKQVEIQEELRRNILSLKNHYSRASEPKEQILMVAEKISGANLLDFAKSRYRFLSDEQKVKFFMRLGRIAMLDLAVGILDRLISVFPEDGRYTLDSIGEANLGNVMVVFTDGMDHPTPFAIDNGIDPDLASDPEHQKNYLLFLSELLSDPEQAVKSVAENISDAFVNGLNSTIDECEGNVAEIKDQLKPFSEDVPKHTNAIREGLSQMMNLLHEKLIPAWSGQPLAQLKKQMEAHTPVLYSSLTERFNLFESMRKK